MLEAPPAARVVRGDAGSKYPEEPRLFTPGQIALSTFFGGPIGGTCLIAVNESRLGSRRNAMIAVFIGILVTAACLAIGIMIPKMPPIVMPVAYVIATKAWSTTRYRQDTHRRPSHWHVVWVTVAGLAVTLAVFFGVAVAWFTQHYDHVTVDKIDVIYEDGATPAQATAVAQIVGEFSPGSEATVVVKRSSDGHYTVGMVMQDSAFNNPVIEQGIGALAKEFSTRAFDGAEVDMEMLDDGLETKREIPWSRGF